MYLYLHGEREEGGGERFHLFKIEIFCAKKIHPIFLNILLDFSDIRYHFGDEVILCALEGAQGHFDPHAHSAMRNLK